ncbi:hypothetical protein DERP_002085 [Dermatophagoides pteronyssinus]|uniref:Uncharacterized protein n=1 Tax=Dermatophagoides pteronyssinus TaxID=6956 RepID=A0ABQ8JH82_DERPT|nr:hypothetical protein DERP_002085 [Dermatophagoides pteronyssinus]
MKNSLKFNIFHQKNEKSSVISLNSDFVIEDTHEFCIGVKRSFASFQSIVVSILSTSNSNFNRTIGFLLRNISVMLPNEGNRGFDLNAFRLKPL